MQLLFTWPLPDSVPALLCMIAFIPYLFSSYKDNTLQLNDLKHSKPLDVILLTLIAINIVSHQFYTMQKLSILALAITFIIVATTYFLVIIPTKRKQQLFKHWDIFLKTLCIISIIGWFMLMFGVPLPHYHTTTNNYYDHEVYYLFLFNISEFEFLPRFAGMFLEPGHLGSTACMMLYINRFNLKKWSNWIYILAIAMSFSLAAYCLLGIGLMLYNFCAGKKVLAKMLGVGVLIGALYIFAITYNDGNNDVYNRIFARLEIVNGEMVGNNRTSSLFDSYYNHWLAKGDVLLGFGSDNLSKNEALLRGTAGYQRFIFLHGFLGVAFVLSLYFLLFWRNRSKLGLGFLGLIFVCNCIRDYPYREMWLFMYIMALPILAEEERKSREGINTTPEITKKENV